MAGITTGFFSNQACFFATSISFPQSTRSATAGTTAALWSTRATSARATATGTTSAGDTSSARRTRAGQTRSTRTTTAAGRGSQSHN